jgi:predicted permease
VFESALATLVLVGAGLCLKSFRSAQQIDRGFDPEGIVVARLAHTAEGRSADERRLFYRRLLDDMHGLPWVQSVSLADWVPLGPRGIRVTGVRVEDYRPEPSEDVGAAYAVVSPHHLANLRSLIRDGRGLTAADDERSPEVVVINETMAEHYWPGRNPLGRYVWMWGRRFRVVGIVGDWKQHDLRETPFPLVMVSHLQVDIDPQVAMLFLRPRQDPGDLIAALERRVHALDPSVHIRDGMLMTEDIDLRIAPQRLAATLMSSLGTGALMLAFMGIFGVLAYVVSQRQREIGVRVALGASPARITQLVLCQGLWLVLPGIGIGLLLAAGLSRLFSGFLIAVRGVDPPIYVAAALLLALAGALACWVPARRALRVDPVAALRSE